MNNMTFDTDVCKNDAISCGFSDYSDGENSLLKAGMFKDDFGDEKGNCISVINGAITISMTERKLWQEFVKVGTEMIISRSGRSMYPYVEFFLSGLDPSGLYDVIFDIIPETGKRFKFIDNEWVPFGKKKKEFKNKAFRDQDAPKTGSQLMSRKISFQTVKLSNKPGKNTCTFTLQTLQKYMVCISLVKHERDGNLTVVDFPIQDTAFIAVTKYHNREMCELKALRFPLHKSLNRLPTDLSFNKRNQIPNHGADDGPVNKATQTDPDPQVDFLSCFFAYVQERTGTSAGDLNPKIKDELFCDFIQQQDHSESYTDTEKQKERACKMNEF
ncbi:T-box transcription factor T-like isoform X2 [Saccostrea cucullata]|uniref:T-box transcription factor T-like isoform X2 n=1 Tax=Saccostrea cuccullata TaxID=36930 RepID=UPI002ED604CC